MNERSMECLRVRISKRPNFSLKSAFQYADRSGDNWLSADDVRAMLADHGFFATERELSFVMRKFDKDADQMISFAEFVEELTPKISSQA
mmetsp:Transcript_7632/g.7009  ORF Transcript_7632/g.7009 Transcript_7632/m.7009 type:complete len:90 (+) Transcript_7632:1823-2092(+)